MSSETIRYLNQLLTLLGRSFPSYLQYARPHVPPDRQEAVDTIASVARDQESMARRISRLIADAGFLPDVGDFPMEYTDSHDLDIDFLMRLAVSYQQQDIRAIDDLVESLRTAPAAKAAAEEALGMAKGHLESLIEASAAASH